MIQHPCSRLAALLFILFIGGCSQGDERTASAPSEPDSTTASLSREQAALLDPQLARDEAPETFRVRFQTTKGAFEVEANRTWAPIGVDRFYNLVRIGFFEDAAFFRAVPGFIVQFGVNGDPAVTKAWSTATIPDDPPRESNARGYLSYAKGDVDSRTTQLFINLKDNKELDSNGFAPIAHVTEGMDVVDQLYSGYGELYPIGNGPRFQLLNLRGNEYLRQHFPEMDYIQTAELVQ
ncbi:MAG: peptidylprolyl isomerase [Acidobacteriota bacterium]